MTDIPPYWDDTSRREFEVSIESVEKINDNYHVRIGEDVIRPAGGGQAGERGSLTVGNTCVSVKDTISDLEGTVLVADGYVDQGEMGHLNIDMKWRISLMRNHTAEHLFVSIINKKHVIKVGELWIDGKYGSVEILGADLTLENILEAELEVMQAIERNLPVESSFVDSNSLDSSVRSRDGLAQKHDRLRIVRVGEMDSSACSGIHVEQTGDIGFFKVIDVKSGEKRTRVEFMAGMNAALHVVSVYNAALARKYSYPFEMEQLGPVLDRAKIAIEDKQMMIEKIVQMVSEGPSVIEIGNVNFRSEFLPGFDAGSLRVLSNQLKVSGPTIILLFGSGQKSQVILRVNAVHHEAAHYISSVVKKLGGKGGGKGEVFTGGFVDVSEPNALYEELVEYVRKQIS
ncbi:MAG: DHHA1 domain-containing protein [Candidatus Thorarchaeota archaeon]